MTRLVMKFGGTSMGNPDRIRETARIVAAEAASGKALTVVVSAMGGETTRLVGLVDVAGPATGGLPSIDDEYDAVVSTGEQFTAGGDDGVILIVDGRKAAGRGTGYVHQTDQPGGLAAHGGDHDRQGLSARGLGRHDPRRLADADRKSVV